MIYSRRFDYTPPEYITLLFTDLGALSPSAFLDEIVQVLVIHSPFEIIILTKDNSIWICGSLFKHLQNQLQLKKSFPNEKKPKKRKKANEKVFNHESPIIFFLDQKFKSRIDNLFKQEIIVQILQTNQSNLVFFTNQTNYSINTKTNSSIHFFRLKSSKKITDTLSKPPKSSSIIENEQFKFNKIALINSQDFSDFMKSLIKEDTKIFGDENGEAEKDLIVFFIDLNNNLSWIHFGNEKITNSQNKIELEEKVISVFIHNRKSIVIFGKFGKIWIFSYKTIFNQIANSCEVYPCLYTINLSYQIGEIRSVDMIEDQATFQILCKGGIGYICSLDEIFNILDTEEKNTFQSSNEFNNNNNNNNNNEKNMSVISSTIIQMHNIQELQKISLDKFTIPCFDIVGITRISCLNQNGYILNQEGQLLYSSTDFDIHNFQKEESRKMLPKQSTKSKISKLIESVSSYNQIIVEIQAKIQSIDEMISNFNILYHFAAIFEKGNNSEMKMEISQIIPNEKMVIINMMLLCDINFPTSSFSNCFFFLQISNLHFIKENQQKTLSIPFESAKRQKILNQTQQSISLSFPLKIYSNQPLIIEVLLGSSANQELEIMIPIGSKRFDILDFSEKFPQKDENINYDNFSNESSQIFTKIQQHHSHSLNDFENIQTQLNLPQDFGNSTKIPTIYSTDLFQFETKQEGLNLIQNIFGNEYLEDTITLLEMQEKKQIKLKIKRKNEQMEFKYSNSFRKIFTFSKRMYFGSSKSNQ
ncbi:nagb/rpia/coa transferase-like superfamily protein [Anaeramoeba ignava]|uniref:Nagb/rpia/coa transferase-like superfamily protein n=1 Tax=Anaeramoeba ignava TaxID=1746090 RepID=A0A9Q0LB59_ANAIG|nr:nagb/rpia/coa transferase-like superfamily protein [Anaeramoeba ignava]